MNVASTVVSDVLDIMRLDGVVDGLLPVNRGQRPFVGPARIAISTPSDSAGTPGFSSYLDGSNVGDVLVIKGDYQDPISAFGGLAARRAASIGIAGIVGDIFVRDYDELQDHNVSIWARGTTPRSGKGRLAFRGAEGPVFINGISIQDGDILVADETGVCVVPAGAWERVRAEVSELIDREARFAKAISDGDSFADAIQNIGQV